MLSKKLVLAAILPCFLIISCSSLDIQQNETDVFEERLKADGKEIREATPIQDFFPELFGNSSSSIINSITFEIALSKFSVMPIITASKQDGIITTDWYSTTSNSSERVKFNIIVKDDNMTNDSIQINMFKEILDGSVWKTQKINSFTAEKIKESILTKARKVKTAAELS
mgnify:FL=1|tara:strand:- start:48 stop:557 length:510 start_codon:yes stop_codon:yes gene_type:complete